MVDSHCFLDRLMRKKQMTREWENGKQIILTAAKVGLSRCFDPLIMYPQISAFLWSPCLSLIGKAGARGHKISDYFEVSGRKWSLSVFPAELMSSKNASVLGYSHTQLSLFGHLGLSIKLLSSLSLHVSVSLREVAVLVPALQGESHQWSALPPNTPSPTPLSWWACLLYGLSDASCLLTPFPSFSLTRLFLNISRSSFTGGNNLMWFDPNLEQHKFVEESQY